PCPPAEPLTAEEAALHQPPKHFRNIDAVHREHFLKSLVRRDPVDLAERRQVENVEATRAHGRSITLIDSIPRSSTTLTAILPFLPFSNGSDTVPWNADKSDSSSSARTSLRSLFQPSFAPAIGKNTWCGKSER